MLRRMFIVGIASVVLALPGGCASTAQMQINAAANQPIEVSASKASAKEAVAAYFVSKGYRITKDSDFVMEFSTPTTNGWAQLLLSSNYDSEVDVRLTMQFLGDKPTTVTWRAFLVTNPGSAFEHLTDISKSGDAPAMQATMVSILTPLNGKA